jgi:hypothetical protein
VSVELLTARDLALVEAAARRTAELVVERLAERDQQPDTARLVDANELARRLHISRSAVYEHAADLGAIRLGDGSNARLRFDLDEAVAAWTGRVSNEDSHNPGPSTTGPIQRPPRRRRRSAARGGPELLPVKGEEAA